MAEMILIIEWMYAAGWTMFGRDEEIEKKIMCIEDALIPRLGMKKRDELKERRMSERTRKR